MAATELRRFFRKPRLGDSQDPRERKRKISQEKLASLAVQDVLIAIFDPKNEKGVSR